MSRARANAAGGPAGPRTPGGHSRLTLALALPALFWGTFAVFVAVQTYLSMLSHGHSLLRLVVYQLVACSFWIVATPLVAFLARRFPIVPWRWRPATVHLLAAAGFALAFLAWLIAVNITLRPYDVMNITRFGPAFVERIQSQFPLEVLVYFGTLGAVYAFDFHDRSRERAIRTAQLERELANARLEALAAQLQPHFLFNALHTVSGLIRGHEHQAAITTLAGLSDILRYALDAAGAPDVPLENELEVTRRYLAIQQLRFGDRLVVTLDPDPATLRALVPRLLLQPLIENAIRHGVAPSVAPSWLALRAWREESSLRLGVSNAISATSPEENGLGIGLRNTRARLEQMYGEDFNLETRRLDDRFELDVRIPWREAAEGRAADA